MRRHRHFAAIPSLAAAGLLAFAALPPFPGTRAAPSDAREQPGDDDVDRVERRFVAERAVRENCLICHSDDLIRTQRLTPAQWQAEVQKMVGWGSPLPPELHSTVTDHLAATYSDKSIPLTPSRLAADKIPGVSEPPEHVEVRGDGTRGATLYATNCANCHGVDGQGAELGPNLVERRALLDGAGYDEVVRAGRGRMPGFAMIFKGREASDVLAWLRSRRYRPVLPASK